ncbi:unnamed protein product [Ceratitis capitata]|uniref:(Mediterranean fruit fly) hypothetical protein n=1 Tax=Ceratitis capitata TaxID=7213 RepID=A0A811U862_CERCA|nr:unnamed protein product [Ceratitis capitata]
MKFKIVYEQKCDYNSEENYWYFAKEDVWKQQRINSTAFIQQTNTIDPRRSDYFHPKKCLQTETEIPSSANHRLFSSTQPLQCYKCYISPALSFTFYSLSENIQRNYKTTTSTTPPISVANKNSIQIALPFRTRMNKARAEVCVKCVRVCSKKMSMDSIH